MRGCKRVATDSRPAAAILLHSLTGFFGDYLQRFAPLARDFELLTNPFLAGRRVSPAS